MVDGGGWEKEICIGPTEMHRANRKKFIGTPKYPFG
jgi:hypothetical protein